MPRAKSEARQQAARDNETFYQGEPCKAGHSGRRYTSTAACAECVRAKDAARSRRDDFDSLLEE